MQSREIPNQRARWNPYLLINDITTLGNDWVDLFRKVGKFELLEGAD